MRVSHRFVIIVALFLTCLITANIMAVKLINVAGLTLPAAIIIFPISYIIGDVLTEVYGYKIARRVIWLGFLCNLIVVLAFWIGKLLPSAPVWEGQKAYEVILGFTPRLLTGSFIAYLGGEFANSIILSRMKIKTKGRFLWSRTIGSTLVGQGIDSSLFILIAFTGVIPLYIIGNMILTHWLVKVSYEIVATPFTYIVVNYLKKKESLDTFDNDVNLNPLLITE